MILVELFVILAVLNATISADQNIPLEVEVNPAEPSLRQQQQSVATVPSSEPASQSVTIDVATISALVGGIGGLFAMFKKSFGKEDSRLNAIADTVTNIVESVKGTDLGSKDTAEKLSKLAQVVESASPEVKKEISANAEEWKTDVKQLYENKKVAPRPGELENDPVKNKLAQVNKVTEKTPDIND